MLKPDPHPENEPEQGVAPDGSPSFEELMLLVFSGPMCFECLDENEGAEDEFEGEGVGGDGVGEGRSEQRPGSAD